MPGNLKKTYWDLMSRLSRFAFYEDSLAHAARWLQSSISPWLRFARRHSRHGCVDLDIEKQRAIKVLIVGIYLADKPNTASHLVDVFANSCLFDVRQCWIALGSGPVDPALRDVTILKPASLAPKFTLINQVMRSLPWRDYDYLIISDDDIVVAKNFLDAFLALQIKYDLAIAQPARSRNSHTDHPFVLQDKTALARQTRFVEIGPLFSMRRDLAELLMPFDETSPMGWGYDWIWPVVVESANLRMGIIDATPMDHSLRPQGRAYSRRKETSAMAEYLAKTPHLEDDEPFQVVEFLN